MKNAVVTATLSLLLAWAATAVQARSDQVGRGQNAGTEYTADLPHILNDRPWVDTCARDRSPCDYTGSTKPHGGNS